MMFSVEDIQSCIQEWFGECMDITEIVKTYHEIVSETDKQLLYMSEQLIKTEN